MTESIAVIFGGPSDEHDISILTGLQSSRILSNKYDVKNIYENAKNEFTLKAKTINWNQYYLSNPFKESGLALYKWSPIADELKVLDKEIVLNSIKLKWNLVENDFKDLTKDLTLS